jgi:hypothetical protein
MLPRNSIETSSIDPAAGVIFALQGQTCVSGLVNILAPRLENLYDFKVIASHKCIPPGHHSKFKHLIS